MQTVELGHRRGWLDAGAAASIGRIDREIGHPLQVTSAGRTWGEQNAAYQTYLRDGYPIALNPNAPSIHQLGNAIDTDERITGVLNRHGWFHTVYRDGVLVEPWHYEYDAARDQHRHDPAPITRTIQEDEMPISYINITGKANARRGGCYAVMRDNGGKLFARFTSGTMLSSVPTVSDERAIAEMQASIPGLS